MPKPAARSILNLFGFVLISATFACAQATTSFTAPISSGNESWESAQSLGSAKHKLIVITLDQPHRRQTCHVRTFTPDKLVCSRAFGIQRTYAREQIAAILVPGDDHLLLLGFLGAGELGASIWGTVVLAATCPACAVATGFAALYTLVGLWFNAHADGQADRTIYLSPDPHRTSELGFIQPLTLAGVN